VLGELDDVLTATSNYIISPFVGLIPYPYDFVPDKWETEELLEVPIADLLDKNCFSEVPPSITDWKLRHISTNMAIEAFGEQRQKS